MTTQHIPAEHKLGFIGLGVMGGPMARNLVLAGYPVTVFDLDPAQIDLLVADGAQAADSAAALAEAADILLTSLPSSAVFVQVAEETLLPAARPGQIIIDMGTTTGPETRRLAAAFADMGATLIDAPVSGGGRGAESGSLHIFVGGDEAAVQQCWPLLQVLGNPEHVVHCGPSGSGQVVKAVNQLAMGLVDAAYMEAIAFGVQAGVEPSIIAQAVGGPDGWRAHLKRLTRRVIDGSAEGIVTKFPELPYFLTEAEDRQMQAPLTRALFAFLDAGPRNWRDNMNRPTVSFWHEVNHRPWLPKQTD